jgi:hypothetical protein
MGYVFNGKEDWEVLYDERKKIGLSDSDIAKMKELGEKLASGIKGSEYVRVLAEHKKLKLKWNESYRKAVVRCMERSLKK